MNTLFNSEACWGCLQGTLIFEFRYYKSMFIFIKSNLSQSSF